MADLAYPPLLVVTDLAQAVLPFEALIEQIFAGGCRWLSVREKNQDEAAQQVLLETALRLAAKYHATVMVHGSIALATKLGLGVHLESTADAFAARAALGPSPLIGQSVHADEGRVAPSAADYVTFSPVFASASKPGYQPVGIAALYSFASASPCPVLALGGIEPENVAGCLAAGAAGIAVMGSVMRTEQPEKLIAALIKEITLYRPNHSQ